MKKNLSSALRKFTGRLKDSAALSEELAKEFHELLIANIRSNKFGFNLAAATIQKRIAKGNDSTVPLIDSGEYISAIIVEKTVVKMMNGKHKGGLSYEELSNILEYGRMDKSILPFDVWGKTYEEFMPIMEEKVLAFFIKDVFK